MPPGVKGIDKQGLSDLSNVRNTVDLDSLFADFQKINDLLIEADDVLANCGLEEFHPHGYADQTQKIDNLYQDTMTVLNAPAKMINTWDDIESKFLNDVSKATNILKSYQPGEVSTGQVDANRILGNNMKKAREDTAAYIALVQSEMSGSDYMCAVDPELGELEKERADLLAHGDRENAKLKEQEIDEAIKRKLSGLNHGESYGMAYDQLKDCSGAEKIKLYFYWKSVDGNEDLTGIEMPSWWREKYLKLPDYINEGNVVTAIEDEETLKKLSDYYYSSYFIIDLISGVKQEGTDLKGNAIYYTDEYVKTICNIRNPKDKEYIEGYGYYDETFLVKGWFDFVYGGMYDFAANINSIRGTKYALSEHFGYTQLKDTKGAYNVFLETDTTLYEFAIEAYLRKYKFETKK